MTAVDVVVPTFRRPEQLKRCLAALDAQTVPPASITVIDDSKTDRGPAWARNQGWRKGSAALVAFTDDDCVPDPDWVASIPGAFTDGVGAVEGGLYRIEDGEKIDMDPPTRFRKARFRTANMAFRRDVLDDIGGFDEGFHIHREDTDIAWRVLQAGFTVPFHPEIRVAHPDRPGIARIAPASERRLMRTSPKWYAECLAGQMHRKGWRTGQLRLLRAALKEDSPDDPRIVWHQRASVWSRGLGIAVAWKVGLRR